MSYSCSDVCETAYSLLCRSCPEHDSCQGPDDVDDHDDGAIIDCLTDKLSMINEMPAVVESMKQLAKYNFPEEQKSFLECASDMGITVDENIDDPADVPDELTTHAFYHVLILNKWIESFNAEPSPPPREE
jgi:hypothetical protein